MGVSANIIVRNEEYRLNLLLPTLKPYIDEIVVVDQQSVDNTLDVAKKYADVVLTDECHGQADASRQLAMDNSTQDWILTIDADEFMTNILAKELPYIMSLDVDGCMFCVAHCRLDKIEDINPIDRFLNFASNAFMKHESYHSQYRLYKKDRVQIIGDLHTGVGAPNRSKIHYWWCNAIVEVKAESEQIADTIRYEAIVNNNYNKDIHL